MNLLRRISSNRLPSFQSTLLVFAVISLVFYSWTILSIAWRLNSWMKNLNPWEVFSLICYLLVFSFLQSLAVLAGLLGLSLILPGNILKENFVVRGNIIAVCVLLSMMLHLKLYTDGIRITLVQSLARWWTVTFLFTLMLAWLLSKLRTVEKAIQEFADRATIFLYIFLPVTVLGGVVVIVRLFLAVI